MSDPNMQLYKALQELADALPPREFMRKRSYPKAIAAMKEWALARSNRERKPIRVFSDADSRLLEKSPSKGGARNVGPKIAKKIRQWNETFDKVTGAGQIGQLQKIREADDVEAVWKAYGLKTMTPEQKIEYELTSVSYIGPRAAQAIRKALNEDPLEPILNVGSAVADLQGVVEAIGTEGLLNRKQALSLKYHDQLSERMPRQFVGLLGSSIQYILEKAFGPPGLGTWDMEVGGSYYRGQVDSGDLDLIVLEPTNLFQLKDVVKVLWKYGIISEEFSQGPTKFLGLGRCPGNTGRVFKIDILFVDKEEEKLFALLHYTIGDLANRTLRESAMRSGLMLEQTGLYKNRGKPDKSGHRTRVELSGNMATMTPEDLKLSITKAIEREQK